MSDKEKLRGKVGSSTNDYHFVAPLSHLPRQELSRYVATKFISSKLVNETTSMIENPPFRESQCPFTTHARNVQTSDVPVSVNNAFLNKEPCGGLDFGITTPFPRNSIPEAFGYRDISSKPVEDMPPMIENRYFIPKQFPFIEHEGTVPTFGAVINPRSISDRESLLQRRSAEEYFVDDLASCRQNTDKHFRNEHSSDQIKDLRKPLEFLSGGLNENIQIPDDGNDFGITTPFPRNSIPEDFGYRVLPSKPVEKVPSVIENPHFIQSQSPFMTHASRVPTSEAVGNVNTISDTERLHQFRSAEDSFVDDLALCRLNTDKHFRNDHLSSDQIKNMSMPLGFQSGDLSENVLKDDRILSSGQEDKLSENSTSTSVKGKDQYIPDIDLLDITHERLALTEGYNPQVRNPDFIDKKDGSFSTRREEKHIVNDPSSSGKSEEHSKQHIPIYNRLPKSETNDKHVLDPDFIDYNYSSKYLQLYYKTPPENYDFAMNIMAYIEHLNDSSWKMTISYFEEYVKKMFKYIWNESKDFFNSKTELQTCDLTTFMEIMKLFTLGAISRNYDLCQFLNYCVIISQVGITARKRNFNDLPMYVIMLLRSTIKEMQCHYSMMFEMHVKKFARQFVEDLKL